MSGSGIFATATSAWLAYSLATAFRETAETDGADRRAWARIEVSPTASLAMGDYGQCYYGHLRPIGLRLTWQENYIKGENILAAKYAVDCPMHRYPHRMLEHEAAALILYDGLSDRWLVHHSASLGDYFNATKEDPFNARRVINGGVDKPELVAGYYESFKRALTRTLGEGSQRGDQGAGDPAAVAAGCRDQHHPDRGDGLRRQGASR